jgi:hypothetical protein
LTPYAEGGNYRFDIERGIVVCKVWMRPDVDRETGARFAAEKLGHFQRLTALASTVTRACLFDLREAPKNWGPATQDSLERCVRLWQRAQRRIALVASNDPLQLLHLRLLVRKQAPDQGRLFGDFDEALDWLLEKS